MFTTFFTATCSVGYWFFHWYWLLQPIWTVYQLFNRTLSKYNWNYCNYKSFIEVYDYSISIVKKCCDISLALHVTEWMVAVWEQLAAQDNNHNSSIMEHWSWWSGDHLTCTLTHTMSPGSNWTVVRSQQCRVIALTSMLHSFYYQS